MVGWLNWIERKTTDLEVPRSLCEPFSWVDRIWSFSSFLVERGSNKPKVLGSNPRSTTFFIYLFVSITANINSTKRIQHIFARVGE